MLQTVYSLIYTLMIPFLLIRLLWRRFSRGKPYGDRWLERFACFDNPAQPIDICFHAVSLGESKLAVQIIEALKCEQPDLAIAVTTTTVTGSQTITEALGDRVFHVYFPFDLYTLMWRFFNKIQPKCFVVMETELWPNAYKVCEDLNIPLKIANARLSENSFGSYKRIKGFMTTLLSRVQTVYAQSEQDAKRFIQLGCASDKVETTGNLKFDMRLPEGIQADAQQLRARLGNRACWVAASTHPGEEEMVLAAHVRIRQTVPDCVLILVPRHPERTDKIIPIIENHKFTFCRYSDPHETDLVTVYVVDAIGVLLTCYAASDVAFVGGSLVPHGGHNPLEPIALDVPTLSGIHVKNFKDIYGWLTEASGVVMIENDDQLSPTVCDLLSSESQRNNLTNNAKAVLAQHRGALQRLVKNLFTF